MTISEDQLETWAKQGPTAQFTATYDALKNCLNDSSSPYYPKDFSVFLQGSDDDNGGCRCDRESALALSSGARRCPARSADGCRLVVPYRPIFMKDSLSLSACRTS